MSTTSSPQDHFKGKDALHHIAEVQVKGMLASAEIHGAETPGSFFAAFDAAREAGITLLLVGLLFALTGVSNNQEIILLSSFSLGLLFWKFGRASWLAWARLERLHRIVEEEQREITENREQEKEELRALYQAKGFEGELLEEVVGVLMADGDRLLRVMLQEELGFRLEENEHPLVQGLGAFIGTFLVALVTVLACVFFQEQGLFIVASFMTIIASAFSAHKEHNKVVPTMVWNTALLAFSFAVTYYMTKLLQNL